MQNQSNPTLLDRAVAAINAATCQRLAAAAAAVEEAWPVKGSLRSPVPPRTCLGQHGVASARVAALFRHGNASIQVLSTGRGRNNYRIVAADPWLIEVARVLAASGA